MCIGYSADGRGARCDPDLIDDLHNENAEILENYYNQKSNDQESGLLDKLNPSFAYPSFHYKKKEGDVIVCYAFQIDMKKCKDPKMNATDPSCQKVCLIHKKRRIIFIYFLKNNFRIGRIVAEVVFWVIRLKTGQLIIKS